MRSRVPVTDPIATYQRGNKAARRVGMGQQCVCGEKRPNALIAGSNPMVCAACKRKSEGRPTLDKHHPAGRANSAATVPISVNDHRAELSVAQYEWPKETLENPDDNPVLR